MTATELAAYKAALQARRLEIQHDRNTGRVLALADITTSMVSRFSAVRARVLGMHVKAAPYMAMANATEARRILEREITEAVEQMVCEYAPAHELTPTTPVYTT